MQYLHCTFILLGFPFLGHLSHSGDLLLWVGVRRRATCVVRRALTSSPQTTGPILTKFGM